MHPEDGRYVMVLAASPFCGDVAVLDLLPHVELRGEEVLQEATLVRGQFAVAARVELAEKL